MNPIDRIYLDYNATSPLSDDFSLAVARGEVSFANPSSQHSSGKASRKAINQVTENLFKHFSLKSNEFSLFYHSGATEGINTILNLSSNESLICFESDHPAVLAVAENLNKKGHKIHTLNPLSSGSPDLEVLLDLIAKLEKDGPVWLNFTYVHNETGVVWPLNLLERIKNETKNCFIHVDSVQMPGKVERLCLSTFADAYTFSGHKFGALKGVGFSFYKKGLKLNPLILGGGQQQKARSGTENVQGIESLSYALDEVVRKLDQEKSKKLKERVTSFLSDFSSFIIVENESLNTICFLHKTMSADLMLIHFDLVGLDVSSGSACSSGSLNPSKTLVSMGYGSLSRNSIRLSFGPCSWMKEGEILKRLKIVCDKITKK